MFLKKSRHKPLFKKFVRLRKNIQNRKKLLTNFEKKKWDNLVTYLITSSQRRKHNFRIYDQLSFVVPKFGNSLKKKYLKNLLTKQRIALFYGNLQNKKLRNLVKRSKLNLLITNSNLSALELLLNSLENRLDTILYRSHFVRSIREARLFIQHRHVFVNNNIITKNSFRISAGDIIFLSEKSLSLAKINVYSSNLWPLPPEFLQINYRTFQINVIDHEYKPQLGIYFPFWLDLNTVINYYD